MAFGLSAAAIGAIGAVGGAAIAANGARSAAKTQANAANQANQTQLDMFNQNRADAQPYREAGYTSLSALMSGMGLPSGGGYSPQSMEQPAMQGMSEQQLRDMLTPQYTAGGDVWNEPLGQYTPGQVDQQGLDAAIQQAMSQQGGRTMQASPSGEPGMQGQGAATGDFNRDFTNADFIKDPGYQFRMDEGRKAMERSAAARGGLMSGGALKALERYSQGYASQEFGNAYNRFNADRDRRFNRLSSLAGIGQTASRDVASMGTNLANNMAGNQLQAGNAAAAGQVGTANAITGGLSQLGNYWQQQQLLRPQSGAPAAGGISGYNNWPTGPGE